VSDRVEVDGALDRVIESGEWVEVVGGYDRIVCCDCGLVHDMDFRVRNGRVQYRPRRNRRDTARMRAKRETL